MRNLLLALLALWPTLLPARVLNVEFKFTPFTGDPKADHVEAVPGKARVVLNNVPIAEHTVDKGELPVLFEAREIAPSVWIPAQSLGPAVRKGKNTLRIEFEPTDATIAYRAQLRWASVTDEPKEESEPGQYRGSNQANEGVEEKQATGTLVMERDFTADFARDRPRHHLAVVTSLSDEDKQRLAALVKARAEWFKPNFTDLYKSLQGREGPDAGRVRQAKCLDAAYRAGVRIAAAPADQLDFATTGGPDVVVRARNGELFPPDRKAFARIKGDETQMCAGLVLSLVYPARLVAVRNESGAWEVVY
ncbi:MAG: hypothetical protein ACREQL_06170 [Candidatus Binatia bacterium]